MELFSRGFSAYLLLERFSRDLERCLCECLLLCRRLLLGLLLRERDLPILLLLEQPLSSLTTRLSSGSIAATFCSCGCEKSWLLELPPCSCRRSAVMPPLLLLLRRMLSAVLPGCSSRSTELRNCVQSYCTHCTKFVAVLQCANRMGYTQNEGTSMVRSRTRSLSQAYSAAFATKVYIYNLLARSNR